MSEIRKESFKQGIPNQLIERAHQSRVDVKDKRNDRLERKRRTHDIGADADYATLVNSFTHVWPDEATCRTQMEILDRILRFHQHFIFEDVCSTAHGVRPDAVLGLAQGLELVLPRLVMLLDGALQQLAAAVLLGYTSQREYEIWVIQLLQTTPFLEKATMVLRSTSATEETKRFLYWCISHVCLTGAPYRDHVITRVPIVELLNTNCPSLVPDICFLIQCIFKRVPLPPLDFVKQVWPYMSNLLLCVQPSNDDPASILVAESLTLSLLELAKREKVHNFQSVLAKLSDFMGFDSTPHAVRYAAIRVVQYMTKDQSAHALLMDCKIPQRLVKCFMCADPNARHDAAFGVYHLALNPAMLEPFFGVADVRVAILHQANQGSNRMRYECVMTLAQLGRGLNAAPRVLADWISDGLVRGIALAFEMEGDAVVEGETMRSCQTQACISYLTLLRGKMARQVREEIENYDITDKISVLFGKTPDPVLADKLNQLLDTIEEVPQVEVMDED